MVNALRSSRYIGKLLLATLFIMASCSAVLADTAPTSAHDAHAAYVKAINSNKLDAIMGMLTDDVVFMAPNSPVVKGKAAVRPWVAGYLKAFKTHWAKKSEEFVVNGSLAIERYSYKSTDTPKGGGAVVTNTGWGLVIYQRGKDGKWRVARDAWGSDKPAK